MRALYVDWGLPQKSRGLLNPAKKAWEIAMIIRSTHYARKENGLSPVLYCDSDTYLYYDKIGLLSIFDEVKPILPNKTRFNPSVFWAAGKFYAILDCQEPFLLIDLDAELRFPIPFEGCDVFTTHLEGISKGDLSFYPDPLYLDRNDFFGKNFKIKWSDKAYNTCLLYFKDVSVAHEYAQGALDFIQAVEETDPSFENVSYILLAEQRFLYEFCLIKNLKVNTLINGDYFPSNYELGLPSFENSNFEEVVKRGFLHVWGFKNNFSRSKDSEASFFGSLVASDLELSEKIINSVNINRELFSTIRNNI
jgi:hypothetical protein